MFQVLEHLDNFKEVLSKINNITTNKAKLLISIPHEEAVKLIRNKIRINDNPPIHVSRWNIETIKRLNGWEIKEYKYRRLKNSEVFNHLFYGIRTIKYPKTRNPIKILVCFIIALTKMGLKTPIEDQYFYLEKI